MSDDAEMVELVAFVRLFGAAGRLLAVHVDDGSGRCSVCSAGAMAGRVSFPCTLRVAAEKAGG